MSAVGGGGWRRRGQDRAALGQFMRGTLPPLTWDGAQQRLAEELLSETNFGLASPESPDGRLRSNEIKLPRCKIAQRRIHILAPHSWQSAGAASVACCPPSRLQELCRVPRSSTRLADFQLQITLKCTIKR